MGMTREEHLQWCKLRALGYVDAGDCKNACASMVSDMGKHEETADHLSIKLMVTLMLTGHLSDPNEVRKFIEGFN